MLRTQGLHCKIISVDCNLIFGTLLESVEKDLMST